MLSRYGDEEAIEDRADHDDLIALLECYDSVIVDGPSKIGGGVGSFFRRRNTGEGYSTPGFWVRRVDGSETDFSYLAAVRGVPKSNAQEFYDACRSAVGADLKAAKARHYIDCAVIRKTPCQRNAHLPLRGIGSALCWHVGRPGVIRTDLPDSLLVDCTMAIGETLDSWMLAHWDELDETARSRMAADQIGLFRRVLSP